ncbi:MAG: hypothetical protein R2849_18120 [Thermomicrobiales bacterium]
MTGKVVVVGHCASGKSTVVESLRSRGVDAIAVAQEHSIVDDLWNHQSPEIVIFLDVSLEKIRERKANPDWPEWIYDIQTERLEPARERADLVVDTSVAGVEETLRRITDFLGVS